GPLAEFTLFGLLAGAKQLPRLQEQQEHHEWPERWPMGQRAGSTVLIQGLGRIGATLARAHRGLCSRVLWTNRSGRTVDGVDELVRLDELTTVLPRVDAIVSTLPGTHATDGLLDAEAFAALADAVTLVNVGRAR